jgi:hypothetical protein
MVPAWHARRDKAGGSPPSDREVGELCVGRHFRGVDGPHALGQRGTQLGTPGRREREALADAATEFVHLVPDGALVVGGAARDCWRPSTQRRAAA